MTEPRVTARTWPEHCPLAVSINVMLESWADDDAPGIGPMGNPLPGRTADWQARSWAAYGPRTGAWRLLDILAARRVKAVFYVSGLLAERNPQLLAAIHAAGHPIAAHGWVQGTLPATQTPEQEATDIDRCIAALTVSSGQRPAGWISPRCTPSAVTTQLLAARQMRWHGDFFDADMPRIEQTVAGPIVALPFSMEINDLPLTIRYGNAAELFTQSLQRIIENSTRVVRKACLDVTVHAHVFGRPAGAIEFDLSLQLLQSRQDIAFLTHHAELADLTLA